MTCPTCQQAIRKWLDYQTPNHNRRWKGQCCLSRADDTGAGACRRCRGNLEMHREKHAETVRDQIALIRRICETRHKEDQ